MNRIMLGIVGTILIVSATSSQAALLLNYQFEALDNPLALAPNQTTPSVNFTSTPGSINALLGYGTNAAGEYPNLIAGPVQNSSVISKNPNSAMEFYSPNSNSSHTRVQINDASSGALDATFPNFTVALWLNPSSTTGNRMAIGKMGGTGERGWQMVSNNGTNDLTFSYFDAKNGNEREFTVQNVFTVGIWTHVAITLEGATGTEKVYINGAQISSSTSGLSALNGDNSADFKVGHRGTTGSGVRSWAGGIDDVRIYDQVLGGTVPGSADGIGSLLTPVPEPNTLLLAGIGMIGMVAFARKRCFA